MAKKYIPNNAWLTCDKGQSPTQISVTHDNNSSIYGEKLVSEADMMPGENIKPFGTCAITGGPCSFMPIYWNKCNYGRCYRIFAVHCQRRCDSIDLYNSGQYLDCSISCWKYRV